jgi:hypothetical protein
VRGNAAHAAKVAVSSITVLGSSFFIVSSNIRHLKVTNRESSHHEFPHRLSVYLSIIR